MDMIEDCKMFRNELDRLINEHPELFPEGIHDGYRLKEVRRSKKSKIPTRRITVDSVAYTIRPSFVMPSHVALTDEVEKALFLRKFDVPFWVLAYIFGRNTMYWYRMEQSLGRNSIVGTTIKDPKLLPEHLAAVEKHSRLNGDKVYVAVTVGEQCILGAAASEDVGEKGLTEAYGKFRQEALDLNPEYEPQSVNTDGRQATVNAWKSLFPRIAVICCLLHVFIKIRNRFSKKFRKLFNVAAEKLWNCYQAPRKVVFSQRVRRLYEWAKSANVPDVIMKPIGKLKGNLAVYSKAYDLPGCHRTSNMIPMCQDSCRLG